VKVPLPGLLKGLRCTFPVTIAATVDCDMDNVHEGSLYPGQAAQAALDLPP
jgi:hypothetical protein